MNNYINFIDPDGDFTILNMDSVCAMQMEKHDEKYIVSCLMDIGHGTVELFKTLEDAKNRFDKILKTKRFRIISTENAKSDKIVQMAVDPYMAKIMHTSILSDKESEFYGKAFIKYVFSAPDMFNPTTHVVAEMFDSYEAAKKQYDVYVNELCRNGLHIVDGNGEGSC